MVNDLKEKVQDFAEVLREGGFLEVIFTTLTGTSLYRSRIKRVETDHLLLQEPARGDLVIPLKPGDALTLRYQGIDAVYEFKTEVIGVRRFGARELNREYAVALPREGVRLQRRQFYRLHTETFGRLRRVRVEGESNQSRLFPYGPWELANLMDISGGGVCLLHNTPFEVGEFAVLEFPIYPAGNEKMFQEIIRLVRIDAASARGIHFGEYAFRSGAYFFTMDDPTREELIQYIFSCQLRARSSGGL